MKAEREIVRPQKGVRLNIYTDMVVKSYDITPTLISIEQRDKRFEQELAAYQQFSDLGCTFVPRLLDHSREQRWFSTERVPGHDLLALSQHKDGFPIPVSELLAQLDEIGKWLKLHGITDLGTNLKDVLLGANNRLYLIDFEGYDQQLKHGDVIEDSLITDLMERLFIRKGRTAQLTPSFLGFVFLLFLRHPLQSWRHFFLVVGGNLRNTFQLKRETLKQWIKKILRLQ